VLEINHLGFAPNYVDYLDAWEIQRKVHTEVASGNRPDTLLLLEHSSVYTAGKRTQIEDRPTDGTPVIDVDRGGMITWHGPGQLVGYPITKLSDPIDVVAYVRKLEAILIKLLARFDILGERVEGRSGVWVKRGLTHDKVAAIGIRVSEGVTMHGFSLNCDNSLDAYASIVACGIRDAGVTTMSALTGTQITINDVVPVVTELFIKEFEDTHAAAV
jgi:lipoyl(octanoyl) transferase